MRTKQVIVLTVCVGLVGLGATGCVGKKKYNDEVQQQDARMSSLEDAIESNERRLDDMGKETDNKLAAVDKKAEQAQQTGNRAMSTAEGASKSAQEAKQGRLIWNVTLTDDRATFSLNGDKLSDSAQGVLNELARKIKGLGKAAYVEIEGHTDSSGSEEFNYKLGLRRATAARNYLAKEGGIPLHALSIISYGESQPVADNGSRDGRAANRRVTIKVYE